MSPSKPAYLRPDVRLRPLFQTWTATEQLIPPATAAMNVKNVQAQLLRSYLDAPEFHFRAARTPSLIGGPWVDVDPVRAPDVESLLARLEIEGKELFDLARAIESLDGLLHRDARGGTLETLYPQVPDLLRGYVELVYDLHNQPSFRIVESLLYASRYYRRSAQSLVLSLINGTAPTYEYSTPWLPGGGDVHLSVPFDDDVIPDLFGMRRKPSSLEQLEERLPLEPQQREAFRRLFTSAEARPYEGFDGPGVRMRYFGHACALFETRGTTVLSDPMIAYKSPDGPQRFTLEDLPDQIDYVVLTHAHKDHVYFETLLQLRGRVRHVVIPKNQGGALQDPSFKRMLGAVGFKNVIELDQLDELSIPDGSITALPFLGEHGDLDIQSKAAHLVRLGGTAFLCAADSNNVEPILYRHLHELIGDIDVLLIGMECVGAPLSAVYGGLYVRPLDRRHDQARRTTGSDSERALAIVQEFRPKHVYIYAMGLEPWLGHILPIVEGRDSRGIAESDLFIAACRQRGIAAARPYCQFELVFEGAGRDARAA